MKFTYVYVCSDEYSVLLFPYMLLTGWNPNFEYIRHIICFMYVYKERKHVSLPILSGENKITYSVTEYRFCLAMFGIYWESLIYTMLYGF